MRYWEAKFVRRLALDGSATWTAGEIRRCRATSGELVAGVRRRVSGEAAALLDRLGPVELELLAERERSPWTC